MRLPFFRKPVRYIPTLQREGTLQEVRERIISILLVSAITLGALALIAAGIPAYHNNQYGALGAYVACYAWILIITIQRHRFSYNVKAYTLSFMFYFLGLVNLVQNGISADGGVFLLSFTVAISLMVGGRSGIFALILSVVTYSFMGVLTVSGNHVPPLPLNNLEPLDWISGSVVFILLSTILTLSLSTILRGLNDSIVKVKMSVIDTEREREQTRLRNQDLQRRMAQLSAAAEIEHTISAVLAPKDLMQKVVDLLGERFGLYHVGVFMLSENASSQLRMNQFNYLDSDTEAASIARPGSEVILQAQTGNIISENYKLTLIGSSNALWAMTNRKPRAVETSNKNNLLTAAFLPMARTELALPILSHDRPIGLLMIHSTQSNAFDSDEIALFQNTANSLAIALENAILFKQNQDDLEEIRSLQKQYLYRAWAESEQVHGNLSFTYQAEPKKAIKAEFLTEMESADQNTPPEPVISTYSTPIIIHDQPIGEFTLEAEKTAWTLEDRTFIESVITEAALALENARLLEETQRRADHDRLVTDITQKVQASNDIETILSSAIRELGRKLQASEAIITLNAMAEDDGQEQPEPREVIV